MELIPIRLDVEMKITITELVIHIHIYAHKHTHIFIQYSYKPNNTFQLVVLHIIVHTGIDCITPAYMT